MLAYKWLERALGGYRKMWTVAWIRSGGRFCRWFCGLCGLVVLVTRCWVMICASGVGFVAVLTMASGVLGVVGCWIRFKRLEFGGKGIVGWGACSVSRSGVAIFWVGGRSKEAGGCKGVAVKERV